VKTSVNQWSEHYKSPLKIFNLPVTLTRSQITAAIPC
jgi:hypothetical protein